MQEHQIVECTPGCTTRGSKPNVTFAESTFMTVRLRGSVGAVAGQHAGIIIHNVLQS